MRRRRLLWVPLGLMARRPPRRPDSGAVAGPEGALHLVRGRPFLRFLGRVTGFAVFQLLQGIGQVV
jgi:hypothetical protein